MVCLGYKAPAKIDHRLLEAKHLFQEVAEAPKPMGPEALLKAKIKQKRHREGYEEGISTSHRPMSAVEFLVSTTPVELLGRATKFELEGPGAEVVGEGGEGLNVKAIAEGIRGSVATHGEVRHLCGDLQVLGRNEFKQLLKWRLQLLKEMKGLLEKGGKLKGGEGGGDDGSSSEGEGGSEEGSEEGDNEELGPEEKLLQEMADVKAGVEHRQKKEKKKKRKLKQKAKLRAAQMAQGEGLGEDQAGGVPGDQMFSLGVLPGVKAGEGAGAGVVGKGKKGKKDLLSQLGNAAAPGDAELDMLEGPSSDEEMEVRGGLGVW